MTDRRWLSLGVALAVAACAPHPGGAPAGPAALRVATYNIEYGGGDLERTAAALRALDVDVAALQEVDVHWAARSAFVDQATTLGERLGMRVRFAPIYTLPGADSVPREFGVALLTRYAIVRWRNDSLTRLSTQDANAAPTRMPGLLDATLDVRGTPVRVLVTHLDYRADPRVRAAQVAELLAVLDESRAPTLLFGDLNAPPDAPELRPLLGRLRDAWPDSAGTGLTYPADSPTKRIDYVLLSPHFRVRSATVPAVRASDHRPVVVDLRLVGEHP
ncbi:Endonuclease/exonuclease/phosphatase [Gemmatirosa kalamazoonensis]|uniref:Endonuclease/exonuclease/phosphatase n=1 Tax=Gemmatirosa kalamazoonensis TaxID=861299 RepID=W0RK32_9BACT|nr:endonuclease/exonuclease/phosphatase family protein [Gemmatirosa kalamazoonensis]AHG89768.1 Endonuclease/exonuclease/phosphatase [Gemmatirosa kalamazoonensis]